MPMVTANKAVKVKKVGKVKRDLKIVLNILSSVFAFILVEIHGLINIALLELGCHLNDWSVTCRELVQRYFTLWPPVQRCE